MGSSKKATVVNYDASIESAQMKSESLSLLQEANMNALSSQKLALYSGEQAVQDIENGLSLLGDYLKDRNNVASNRQSVYKDFLSGTTERGSNYADKASGVLSRISEGYTSG